MLTTITKPGYPENAYRGIFGYFGYSGVPSDAEETLEHVMKTLTPREAEIFMLYYKDNMTFAEIGKKYNLNKQRVQYFISKGLQKLRHSSRSEILSMGREAYLKSAHAGNEEDNRNAGQINIYEAQDKLAAYLKKAAV